MFLGKLLVRGDVIDADAEAAQYNAINDPIRLPAPRCSTIEDPE
jgi:hypothetical protein